MKNFFTVTLAVIATFIFVSCSDGKNLEDLIETNTDDQSDSGISEQNDTDRGGDTNNNTTEPTDNTDPTTNPTDEPTNPTDEPTNPTDEPTNPTDDVEPTNDDDPANPTDEPTNPTDEPKDPTDPTTDPTDPTTDPTDPTTDPTDPTTDPTDPTTDPTDPTSDPTDPTTDPTDPTTDPTDPTTDPTDPTTDPTDPADPFEKCTEITLVNTELAYYKHSHGSEKYDIFKATYTPNTGSATSDTFYLKFYGLSEYDYTTNFNLAEINQGSDRGLFLSVHEDEYCDSYSGDCTHGKTYFQKAGTVKVISAEFNFTTSKIDLLSAELNGVVLEETGTNESKACLKIKDDPTVEYHWYY